MLKILQARLQPYMNCELPDVKLDLEKAEEPEIKITNICWIIEKAKEFQKISTSASLTKLKPLTVWITTNCGIFLKGWEYQITLPASRETCMQIRKEATVRTGYGTTDWFKTGKGVHQGCVFHPAYLTLMQSTLEEILGWMTPKLKSRLLGEISIT